MSWTEPIDAYCERLGTAFWAEPLNAVSNLAFIVAASIGLMLWRHAPRRDAPTLALVVLVFVIGAGSFLFHTFANRWSNLADILPIALFIYSYFAFALSRFVGLSTKWTAAGTIGFLAASWLAGPLLRPFFGSSAGYVPALLAMLGIGGWLLYRSRSQGRTILAAGLVFTASLGWRMMDEPACALWPAGTHFLWHIFNAATLGLLLAAAVGVFEEKGRMPPPKHPASRRSPA